MIKTVELFGCNVAALDMNESIREISYLIDNNIKTQHVVLNAGKIVLMDKDSKLKEIIKGCRLIHADGQSIVWASKILNKPLPERVAGIDLMEELIKVSVEKGYGVYFFGAKEEVVKKVVELYKYKYPNLNISGYRNGYFTSEEVPKIIKDMNNSRAQILLVAFSSPKKEYWLSENMNKLNIPFCMGVGGSFDVVAGVTKRAPIWMQKSGLEWFYRFLQEPRRMWRRYLVGNAKFIHLTMKERRK